MLEKLEKLEIYQKNQIIYLSIEKTKFQNLKFEFSIRFWINRFDFMIFLNKSYHMKKQ